MLIRIPPEYPIRSSEIAPERLWLSRRQFVTALGLSGIGLAAPAAALTQPPVPADAPPELVIASRSEQAGGEKPNSWEDITQYNNYYEFGTDKTTPAEAAKTLKPRPWTLTVDGECESPGTVDIDTLLKTSAIEERIYRHRCVEAWSIVVPWAGVPLGAFLKRFKPTSRAKYVSFVTLWDRRQMPLTERRTLPWPYREGLRIDEAMHPLALLTLGVYGRLLPNQNGAPLRLTIPWKYGFKGIKSIVRIKFTETQPESTWNLVGPGEYGFYANVNPAVDHPRWSQASERRLGEFRKRATLPFNGYPEVAPLYAGLDLRKFY